MTLNATILIVDDVPENLAVAHDALDAAGYTVRVATGGLAALESARRQPPDLILLDAVMPGLDGFETCRRLKADLSTRQIPVVFMTGLTDSEHVVLGFQAGGIDYVTKPIRTAEVIAPSEGDVESELLVEKRAPNGGDPEFPEDAKAIGKVLKRQPWRVIGRPKD